MKGSRLFITSENQAIAREWVDELNGRRRARKAFDKYPDTSIVVHPWGTQHDPSPHVDRLYERQMLSLGSQFTFVDARPAKDVETRKREMDDVLDEWDARMVRAAAVQRVVHGWGEIWPAILFVGDRYNGERRCALPFSNKTGSSKTLSELLDWAKIPEGKCYFVNAYTGWGHDLLTAEGVALLRPRVIVALGREAAQRIETIGVSSYVDFPHPQFIARMGHLSLPAWGAKLSLLVEAAL